MRLDKYLVEQAYFESRNRALESIKAGKVKVDGKVAKASAKVGEGSVVEVENEKFYVSRAARKLESFLESHTLNLKDKNVLDVGSSTGGFTQILLEHDVSSVTCVDVGKEQLHGSLRSSEHIKMHEETDIRDFESESFDVVTCDVSFISVLQILADLDRLSSADIVLLYKPQFEVGREVKRDSKGVVQDGDAVARTKEHFEVEARKLAWQLQVCEASQIVGKEGNVEYFYHFSKGKDV